MAKDRTYLSRVYEFWFKPVSAAGFGMMRMAFGLIAFTTMLLEMPNVQRFYGPNGILTHDMIERVVRNSWRFSLLDNASETFVWLLSIVLLVSLFCVMLGVGRKWTLLVATILLFSFHEYGLITLDGGDTLMRLIAFILLLSPCYRTFSIANLRKRQALIRTTGTDQPAAERTMPIWPYRLLLWQIIILYVASAVEKWTGNMWREGSAVAVALHLSDFSRLTPWVADRLSIFSPIISYFTLLSQFGWGLIIVIGICASLGLVRTDTTNRVKRLLIVCGLLIHGAIFLMMDVGTFSLTVFTAYLGLLLDDDFRTIRGRLSAARPIVVLYDGRCGLCNTSVFILSMLDWLHNFSFANYHDPENRKRYAPNLGLNALSKEMHIRLGDGSYRKGFFAFRIVAWRVPVLWPLAPLGYLPGAGFIGSKVYAYVANHR